MKISSVWLIPTLFIVLPHQLELPTGVGEANTWFLLELFKVPLMLGHRAMHSLPSYTYISHCQD